MTIHEMIKEIRAAEKTIKNVENVTLNLARVISGRLRSCGRGLVSVRTLRALKKELKSFNAVTGKWKDD